LRREVAKSIFDPQWPRLLPNPGLSSTPVGLAMNFDYLWREIELSLYFAWAWVQAEAQQHPLIPLVWVSLALLLWRMMKGRD
jgi:hypothetical protein